jgi:integrase
MQTPHRRASTYHYYPYDGKRRISPKSLGVSLTEPIEVAIKAMEARGDHVPAEAPRPAVDKPLLDHLADYLTYKQAKNLKSKRPYSVHRVRQVIVGCGFITHADVTWEKVVQHVSSLIGKTRREGINFKTANDYLEETGWFFDWLVKTDRAAKNPLAAMERFRDDGDTRYDRRAFTDAELDAIFRAALASTKTIYGFTGRDRCMLYRLAAFTGLRAGALATLTPASFDLDATPPTVNVRATEQKNKNRMEMPLHSGLVADLREYLAGRPADRPVWAGKWVKEGAAMLRVDLAAAGVPDRTKEGNSHFHSFRHTFTTRVARAMPNAKVGMSLTGHRDADIFAHYTHTDLNERAEVIERIGGKTTPPSADPAAYPPSALGRRMAELADDAKNWRWTRTATDEEGNLVYLREPVWQRVARLTVIKNDPAASVVTSSLDCTSDDSVQSPGRVTAPSGHQPHPSPGPRTPMNALHLPALRNRVRRIVCAAVAAAVVLSAPDTAAGRQPPSLEPRVVAGRCQSPAGTLLCRENPDKVWRGIGADEEVHSRDLLLALPGFRAALEPRPKSVRLELWGNLPQLSSFPGMESAVVLHDSRAYDLDFTLLRGRVLLTNQKAKGPARVWLRLPERAWELTLAEPGDQVALEIYGRWPQGIGFARDAKDHDTPTQVMVTLVIKGRAEIRTESNQYSLRAPPGPAYIHWDSVGGLDDGPQRRDQLPLWADPGRTLPADGKLIEEFAEKFQAALKAKTADDVLADLLAASATVGDKRKAALTRQCAILGLAALDELPRVAEALADPKSADVRETAVVALRHWIGVSAGRDQALYQILVEQLRYPAAQAETVMQMLHSPFLEGQPETYEALIAYLKHSKLAVRELARWHLYRMAPAGRDIAYDPAAPEAERDAACAAWKKLIPSGQLPPKEKKDK